MKRSVTIASLSLILMIILSCNKKTVSTTNNCHEGPADTTLTLRFGKVQFDCKLWKTPEYTLCSNNASVSNEALNDILQNLKISPGVPPATLISEVIYIKSAVSQKN